MLTALEIVLIVVAVIVAPRNRRPSSALAWILLITFLPVVGIILFAVIGSPKLPRHRRSKQHRMDELIVEAGSNLSDVSRTRGTPAWLPSVAQLNQTVGAMPLLEGNESRLLTTFEEQLAALVEAVRGARRYVHVEFYILSHDATTAPFFAALGAAVERGVTVRVLLDHLGSRSYPGTAGPVRSSTGWTCSGS